LKENVRAEIVVNGLVQGVGFRYFVSREAEKLNLNGYVKNLYTGEVCSVVEGPKHLIEEFFNKLKIGPMHAHVKNASIRWTNNKNEFKRFEIRY
jgi:acylphosphatase